MKLILIGGAPGTCKSTLAARLSRATGLPSLGRDEVKRALTATRGTLAVDSTEVFYDLIDVFIDREVSLIAPRVALGPARRPGGDRRRHNARSRSEPRGTCRRRHDPRWHRRRRGTVGAVEREEITVGIATRLVTAQFPRWAALPLTPVRESGLDNLTFRLGEDMSVRLPAAERYAHQVEKEHRWLPVLSRHLPLPIPEPLVRGEPGHGYPWHWSIYRWLPGATAGSAPIADLHRFAADLGSFLAALHRIDPTSGPPATDRNWFRARASARDEQTRAAITALEGVIDTGAAYEVWEAARRASELDSPTWIHGDVSASNLLVVDGRLSAVIDFGCSGIGDPAFDLEVAWDLLSEESRATFRDHLELDDAAWARGRGWKLWAASRALLEGLQTGAEWVDWPRRVIVEVLADHNRRLP